MRDVFEGLERLGIRYFLTGSEALGCYGEPRQTMDVDLVLDIAPDRFGPIEREFERRYLVAEPLDFSGHWMASLVALSGSGKFDLILSRTDAFGRSAMDRRVHWTHPQYGPIWVSSLEDLILAKLEWSGGTSELQLRDCRNLVVVNRQTIDWAYLEQWAPRLGIEQTLEQVRHAP